VALPTQPAALVSRLKALAARHPELLKAAWRGRPHPLAGHCYIVCEALCHALPGHYRPHVVRHEGGTHWFVKTIQGRILDPTASQFKTPPPYHLARPCGFLTAQASRRTQRLLDLAKT